MHAGAGALAVEGVGVDEESSPCGVDARVDDSKDEPEEDMPDQRAEELARALDRPVDPAAGCDRQERHLPQEPPEHRIAHAPAHRRAYIADVRLKKHAEGAADQACGAKMEGDGREVAAKRSVAAYQGVEFTHIHPSAEDERGD